jgi:hypothetical protein
LGRDALAFTSEMEYGPVFMKKTRDISQHGTLKSVTMKFDLYQADTLKELIGVIEIKDRDKQVSWEGLVIKQAIQANHWNSIELHHSFPEPITDRSFNVNMYIWNKGKQKFFIDDFRIIFETNQVQN